MEPKKAILKPIFNLRRPIGKSRTTAGRLQRGLAVTSSHMHCWRTLVTAKIFRLHHVLRHPYFSFAAQVPHLASMGCRRSGR
jgi:hypothetical protein